MLEVEWLRNDRVLLYRYADPIDFDKDAATLAQQRPYFERATRPIHRIVDTTRVTTLPPNLLSALMRRTNLSYPMSGVVVAIIDNGFLRMLAEILTKVMPSVEIRLVHSMAEATSEIDRILAHEPEYLVNVDPNVAIGGG